MPTYEYACPDCGGFEAYRSMAQRNDAVDCPQCGQVASRAWTSAPRLGLLEEGTRKAMDVNERARHEPKRSGEYARMRHPSGCGCCSPGQRSSTVKAPDGSKAFPSKRPWMISH